jgi:hypothetical protein
MRADHYWHNAVREKKPDSTTEFDFLGKRSVERGGELAGVADFRRSESPWSDAAITYSLLLLGFFR